MERDEQIQAFLDTCAALERNELDAAKAAIFRLQRAGKTGPELRILAFLYEGRLRTPSAGWVLPFLEGWADAGKPRSLPLLERALGTVEGETPPAAPEADVARAIEAIGAAHGLSELIAEAWRGNDTDRMLEAGIALAHEAETLPAQLFCIALLRNVHGAPALEEQAKAAARSALERIAREQPFEPALQARALLEATSRTEPLSEAEAEMLQSISRRPKGHQSLAQLYRMLADAYGGTVQSKRKAFADACALYDMRWIAIWSARAGLLAQAKPERAAALSDAMERIGEQVASGRSLLEALWGLALVREAAQRRNDLEGARSAVRRLEELLGLVKLELPAIDRWPIAPLASEFLDWAGNDELGLKRKVFVTA